MSILSEDELSALIDKAKDYDYYRFSWADLNGIPRGRTVPGRLATDVIKHGVSEITITLAMGPRSKIPQIASLEEAGYPNSNFMPASKLYDLPWAGDDYKVGQIMCESRWPDGTAVGAQPRYVARTQYEKLHAMGYKLYTGFEAEFIVVDSDTMKPVFDGKDYATDLVMARNSAWLFDVEKNLAKCGIDVSGIHSEYAPGQFEFVMAPQFGLEVADDMMIFKQAMKEVLPTHGCKPTFMTRPFGGSSASSGFHFNHSLWDNSGKCVFYDASKPDKMSDTMRHWVGGIMKHIKALLVLCSPTPNCFRRLHRMVSPDKEDWGVDNHHASIRVRASSERVCLVENRLPSSACNPYIVTAATIAAGLDGIENKIEPPPKGRTGSTPTLPSMQECIEALESDTALIDRLGKDFVDWWITAKRQNELSQFGNLTMADIPPEDELEKEREEYFDFI